jgi:hypothetical protein
MINNNNISPQSFGAQFINPTLVKRYNPTQKTYFSQKVSFVKLDPKDVFDVLCIDKTTRKWKGDVFGRDIFDTLNSLSKGNGGKKSFFALTSQDDNFGILASSNILGIAQIQDLGAKHAYIDYLQVNPNYNYETNQRKGTIREFKNLGKSILNSLKQIYTDSITLKAGYWCTDFYIKNGFEKAHPENIIDFTYKWGNVNK